VCAYVPLSRIQGLRESARRADRAAAEVFQYLDREPGVAQMTNALLLDPPARQLELVDVTLVDGAGHKLLEEVSLQIPVGSRAAIVSLDPRMPHAVAGLWPRFFDPQHGQVLFDAKDARYCTLSSLRSHLGLVLQEGLLFTGSVAENISCGDPGYSVQQISEAAKATHAYEFVQRLPLGFATTVGEHGMHLSPGQQFRIGLARAILREPAVLVLEEPEEEADPASNELLDAALTAAARNRTLIVFPARLNTLRSVDRVFLLHEGKLAAEGSHAELVQKSDLYRHLLYMRFNTFRDGKK
jgi:ABC-type multidrug transport system fused ATPase/permease subunit